MAKRRGHHEGSIYQRHDHASCPPLVPGPLSKSGKPTKVRPDHKCCGRWVSAIDLGIIDDTRKRKIISGQTRQEVARKLETEKQEIGEHGVAIIGMMTLSAWMDHWLDEIAAKRCKPSTLNSYSSQIKNYIKPAAGQVKLDKLTDNHVLAIHKLAGKTSSTTAGHAHALLSKALKDAVKGRKVRRNICDYVDKPFNEATDVIPLSTPEAQAVLRHVAQDRLAARWHIALLTGERQGEVLGLTWSCINLKTGTMDLEWQLQRVAYAHGCGDTCGKKPHRCPDRHTPIRPGLRHRHLTGNTFLLPPKTKGSMRIVPMSPSIHAYLTKRHAEYLLERDKYTQDYDLVFCRKDGGPLGARRDWDEWQRILKALGIPPRALHSARHTAATLLKGQGVDEATIMQILGHSNALTTRRYAHVDVSDAHAALTALDGVLGLGPGA